MCTFLNIKLIQTLLAVHKKSFRNTFGYFWLIKQFKNVLTAYIEQTAEII